MSYLLTEIALEMLGYKFYDTNGVFHLTNFQQSMPASPAASHPDEPPLIDFIDQPEAQNGTAIGNGHELATTSGRTFSAFKSRRTPAKALAKIMNYESEKIRNQISTRVEKTINNKKMGAKEETVPASLALEKIKILEDAAEMKQFREFLEERLRRIDSRPYEKYVRTFNKESGI